MDWDKTIDTVGEVCRKAFTLALSAVLVFVAVGGTYIAGLTVWWLVEQAQKALGS
jgi:hypothetical protein